MSAAGNHKAAATLKEGLALKIDEGATQTSEVFMVAMLRQFSREPGFVSALKDEECVIQNNVAGSVADHRQLDTSPVF